MTQYSKKDFTKTNLYASFFHLVGRNLSHVCHATGTKSGGYGGFKAEKKIFKKMKKIQKVFKNGRFLRGFEQWF